MRNEQKILYALEVILLFTCLAFPSAEILNAGQNTRDSNTTHQSAYNGTYYLAIDGNDIYPGTLERPLKTLEKAIQIVSPGETIYIRGGTYHCDKSIFCDKSGEDNRPISILAYQNEEPVFDFSMAWGNGFVIRGAYWHIKGLVVQNAGAAGMVIQSENAHHNTIENITTQGNNNTGLSLRSGAADNLIINCDAHHNFDPVSNGEDADGFGAKFGLGRGNVFKFCRAWNNSDDAFDFWHAGAGVRVEDCYGWDNGRNVWEHPLFQGNSNGFKLGQLEGDHVLIRCVAWDHPGRGFDLNGNSTGVTLHNCTAFRNGTNFAFTFTKGNIEKNMLRNCLSFSGSVRMKSEVDDKYNNWNDSPGVEITKEDFVSLDDSAIKGSRSPDGSLPASDFLKLAAGSDAIDAGTNVGLPFKGSSPDLGAFECPFPGGISKKHELNKIPSTDHSIIEKPLKNAVEAGQLDAVKRLIDKDSDIQDDLGLLLMTAVSKDHPDVAAYLIDHGANVDYTSDLYCSPLNYAARYGQSEMAKMLIARGADAGRIDRAGRKALHYASRFGHEDIVTLLLTRDSQVNTRDKWGWTPLHLAARGANKNIVASLLEAGARTNTVDNRGRRPLDMAGSRDVAELLRIQSDKKDATSDKKNMNSDKPCVVLERGDVRAVIVNNEPVDDEALPGHRGGYSGVASLTHSASNKNLFVPFYAGLNFEHIHDGTVKPRDILFEPRQAPMEIRRIDEYMAELYQPPTPHWQLESWLRYRLLEDGAIEMTLECIPRARTFKNDYIGLFFASYIDKPESLDIHFLGRPADENSTGSRWIRGVTPEHGKLPTHLAVDDNRSFDHDPNFPLTLVFNKSNYRYTEPWYYGVSHGMAFVLMFRPGDNVRLSQSPSGGGNGNPAWDFQWFVPQYKVGQRYHFVMRAMYLPFESQQQIIRATARHRAALEQQ